MDAIDFVRNYKLPMARHAIAKASLITEQDADWTSIYFNIHDRVFYAAFWIGVTDDLVLVTDIKLIVEAYDVINSLGGLVKAKAYIKTLMQTSIVGEGMARYVHLERAIKLYEDVGIFE